jgi:hypothetical protein
MNDFDNIENVFREKLSNYQEAPPEAVWERIGRQIAPQSALKPWFLRKTFLRYAAAIILLGSISSSYFFGTFTTDSGMMYTPRQTSLTNTSPGLLPASVPNNQEAVKSSNQSHSEHSSIEAKKIIPLINEPASDPPTLPLPVNAIAAKSLALSSEDGTEARPITQIQLYPPISSAPALPLVKDEPILANAPVKSESANGKTISVPTENPLAQTQNADSSQKHSPVVHSPSEPAAVISPATPPVKREYHPYSLALLGGADRLYNTSTPFNSSMNTDLRFSLQMRDFYIQTGLGVDHSSDQWNYSYDVRQKEVIGTYQRVDSMYFTQYTDTLGNVYYAPNYLTSSHAVYDSVNHHSGKTVNDFYTYLHLPLLVGYKVFNYKKLEVNIKGGPVFSVLINKHENTPGDDFENARIVAVRNNRLNRLSTNWYMLMGCEFGYALNERFSLRLEPTVRYFKEPFYTTPGLSVSPWSAGLRFGIRYGFGRI